MIFRCFHRRLRCDGGVFLSLRAGIPAQEGVTFPLRRFGQFPIDAAHRYRHAVRGRDAVFYFIAQIEGHLYGDGLRPRFFRLAPAGVKGVVLRQTHQRLLRHGDVLFSGGLRQIPAGKGVVRPHRFRQFPVGLVHDHILVLRLYGALPRVKEHHIDDGLPLGVEGHLRVIPVIGVLSGPVSLPGPVLGSVPVQEHIALPDRDLGADRQGHLIDLDLLRRGALSAVGVVYHGIGGFLYGKVEQLSLHGSVRLIHGVQPHGVVSRVQLYGVRGLPEIGEVPEGVAKAENIKVIGYRPLYRGPGKGHVQFLPGGGVDRQIRPVRHEIHFPDFKDLGRRTVAAKDPQGRPVVGAALHDVQHPFRIDGPQPVSPVAVGEQVPALGEALRLGGDGGAAGFPFRRQKRLVQQGGDPVGVVRQLGKVPELSVPGGGGFGGHGPLSLIGDIPIQGGVVNLGVKLRA